MRYHMNSSDAKESTKITDFENIVMRLQGRRVMRVYYYEIPYETGAPSWNRDVMDTLDFGLELEVESGQIFSITWGDEFVQYGISISENSLTMNVIDVRVWDVTMASRWSSIIGQMIVDIDTYWSWVESDDERQYYPQDIRLVFESGQSVFLSAAQYVEDSDELLGFADEVTVIFSDDVARHYRVGPYADTV